MHAEARPNPLPEPFLQGPIWAYNNWSAYDELSDTVPLTESLAMRELDEILRLRKAGVRVDYYVMDAFWYDPELPESIEANRAMSKFLVEHLK